MMRHPHWKFWYGTGLVVLSVAIFGVHFLIFHDTHQILIYFIQDLGFVPIQVLLVTLILQKFIEESEKLALRQKMNMAIGVFFSDIGNELLARCQTFDLDRELTVGNLIVKNDWTEERFEELIKRFGAQNITLDCKHGDLAGLREFLLVKRDMLLRLLENPNLLEHQQFTDLLWAVFHLMEELAARKDVASLTEPDCAHLAGDLKRAYTHLITGWLSYMMHLKTGYPYLFSLAVRTNPFDADAKPEVK